MFLISSILGTFSSLITFLNMYISINFFTWLLFIYKVIIVTNDIIKTNAIKIFNIVFLFNLVLGLLVSAFPSKAVEHIILHNYTFSSVCLFILIYIKTLFLFQDILFYY